MDDEGGFVQKATVGVMKEFSFKVNDSDINPEDLEVIMTGKGGEEIVCKPLVGEDGVMKYGGIPTEEGDYEVTVRFRGADIGTKPLKVEALKAEWEGSGLEEAVVGEKGEIDVSFFDVDGEQLEVDEEVKVKVWYVGENGEKEEVEVEMERDGDEVLASYVPKKEGKYLVELVVGEKTLKTQEVETMKAKELEAKWEGEGLEKAVVGEKGEIDVSLFDENGEKVKAGEDVKVKVWHVGENGEKEEVEVEMERDGDNIKASYVPEKEGKYLVELTAGDKVLKSQELEGEKPKVKELEAKWEGRGLEKAVVGEPGEVDVSFFDENGEKVKAGEDVKVKVWYVGENGEKEEVEVEMEMDGDQLKAKYVPEKEGKYLVELTAGDKVLKSQEVEGKAKELEAKWEGEGLEKAVVGEKGEIDVSLFDENGEKVKAGEDVKVKVWHVGESGEKEEVEVEMERDGDNIKASYVPEKEGKYLVELTSGDKVLKSQELEGEKPKAKELEAKWEGRGLEKAVVGKPGEVDVSLFDENGEKVKADEGDLGVKVWCVGENGEKEEVRVEMEMDGDQLKAKYVPEKEGKYLVELTAGDKVLKSQEVEAKKKKKKKKGKKEGGMNVTGKEVEGKKKKKPASTKNISVEVGGFDGGKEVVGVDAGFFVRFRDEDTGELVDAPEGFEVEVEGADGEMLEVRELGEGEDNDDDDEGGQQFRYTPKEVGKLNVRVKVKDQEVFAKELDIYKIDLGDEDGGDVEVGDAKDNELPMEVTGWVDGKVQKVPITALGGWVEGRVTGERGTKAGECGFVQDGEGEDPKMKFSVQEPGESEVGVFWKNGKVGGVRVRGVKPVAKGEGLKGAQVGVPATFVVEFSDEDGKKKKKKGAKLKEMVKKKKGVNMEGIEPVVMIDGEPVKVTAKKVLNFVLYFFFLYFS